MNERRFKPSEAHKLDDPERARFLPTSETIGRLGLAPGMVVADIGAGTGYFALPIAREVAPDGRLLAVDAQREMLDLLRARLGAPDSPSNIDLTEGEASATGLPDTVCDLVFMANIWHELDDHATALGEARRILRAGGRLAILDWKPESPHPPGPPKDHRIAGQQVRAVLSAHGWKQQAGWDAGSHAYLLVFTPHPVTSGRPVLS